MSQLKTHQLAYRKSERQHIAESLAKAEADLEEFGKNPPNWDDAKQAMLYENHLKGEIRRLTELLATLDKRVARLS